jgi:aspartate/methionine/tyrosine aminotransferase
LEGFHPARKAPQGTSRVFADASRWTDDSGAFAFEILEKAGVGVAPGVDFGQAGKRAVRFSYASSAVEREVV